MCTMLTVVQPMGHELGWTVVQPMGHGVEVLLYNPWLMDIAPLYMLYNPSCMANIFSINHGLYNTIVQHCMAHGPWDPVTLHGP